MGAARDEGVVDVTLLTAAQALALLADGRLSAEELTRGCLARITADEPRVQAWAFLDEARALQQARRADLHRKEGRALGALHGLPVGVKDIVDTADMATEDGTVLHAGRRPFHDATAVERLRAAGAVILGKTVTTELATGSPGKTRNPHDPQNTPGGSSSGSAAAVAAHMVPVAIGTQTNGGVIGPAAFCGVYGFKPTFGLVPRTGILTQSLPLDQVGFMARSVEDIAIIAEPLVGYDEHDKATRPAAPLRLREIALQAPPLPPVFAYTKTPNWQDAAPEAREAFEEVAESLGEGVKPFNVPSVAADAWEWHRTLVEADIARHFHDEYERGRDRLSEALRSQIERGRRVSAFDYNNAIDRMATMEEAFEEVFDRCDAILTAAAPGPAPRGLESTGNPAFCTLWTFAGMPAISLPLLSAGNGMPMGVQLVGRKGDDARLLRTARWLDGHIRSLGEPSGNGANR
ncbi:MAG TPA: amidase [Usitatibacter sp.]|jgi:Asp-tRNA(Asn)/Glu-tRNA(Gln) amidotransferase A subunit family amidase|nr:amidase [Usitatibacter sp.]